MHESELGLLADCVECGATISIARDRAFALGDDRVLCFECSARRGGRYDEAMDEWASAPDVVDLPRNAEP